MSLIEVVKAGRLAGLTAEQWRAADLDARDAEGWTALHWASILNDQSAAVKLMGEGADHALHDEKRLTALDHCILNGHDELAIGLMELGIDLLASDGGFSYAHRCASVGSAAVLRRLFTLVAAHNLVALRDRNGTGRTPLHWAAQCGDPQTIQILLEGGAEIDSLADDFTPLHIATGAGNYEAVRILLSRGAGVNEPCPAWEDGTALHSACAWGRAKLARILLRNGANTSALDTNGKSPLDYTKSSQIAALIKNYTG